MTRGEVIEWYKQARERIAKPENWCQNKIQKDKAVCAFRALWVSKYGHLTHAEWIEVYKVEQHKSLKPLLDEMERFILIYNDNHTHGEVLAAFDRAITKVTPHG